MHAECEPKRHTTSRHDAAVDPPQSLPFAHLNLRRNPFGELELSRWAELAVVEVDRFVPRLTEPGYALQFTGDKGRGKTTHMAAIMRHFPRARYVHVGETQRPRIPQGHPLLIDEIQRLPRRTRRRIFRRPVSLVVATHEDMSAELAAAGFEVQTVEVGKGLDARRLREILNRRIEAARRGSGPLPRVTLATAQAMIDRFANDLRAIQWHVYDLFQSLPGIQDV